MNFHERFNRFKNTATTLLTPDPKPPFSDAAWECAQEDNAEFDYIRGLGQGHAHKPGLAERFFVYVFAWIASFIMTMLWFVPGFPAWLAITLRLTAMFAFASFAALFSGDPPPSRRKLRFWSGMWVKGFKDIERICFADGPQPPRPAPISWQEALRETVLGA